MNDPCAPVRTSLSALLDGEEAPLARAEVDAHVAVCGECAAYVAVLPALDARVASFRALPVPDRTADVLAASPTPSRATGPATGELRGLVGLAAAVQLVVAVVALTGVGGDHVVRDLAVLELATAGGLASVAWRPWLAAGVLPVIAVGAVAGLVFSVGELLAGSSSLGTELSHLVLLAATWPLAVLARRTSPGGTVERA